MDTLSHGLWGSLAFGRKNAKSFWTAFFFGVAPDLFSFGFFFVSTWLGIAERPNFDGSEPPNQALIPPYIGHLYNITHSLLIFLIVFGIVWLIRKAPFWEMGAWGLHIFFDIPTHSYNFFPTPFLWPLSNFKIDGHPWSDPIIFWPNLTALAMLYGYFFIFKKRKQKDPS